MSVLSQLCQQCGLCCDGTLFSRVPLTTDEEVPEVALQVIRSPTGARSFPQRCAALDGCRCTEYPRRPKACRAYECLLVGALRSDEVSLEDALEVVHKAKAFGAAATPEREDFLTFHFGRRS